MEKFLELQDEVKSIKTRADVDLVGAEGDLTAFILAANFTGRELIKEAKLHRKEYGPHRSMYGHPSVREILERILRKREDS